MTSALCASRCPCVAAQSAIGIHTTVTISHDFYGLAPVNPVAVTIVAHTPFATNFFPPAHSLGCGLFGTVQAVPSTPPAHAHPATQVHRNRDLVQEWADERMADELLFWADVFKADKPKFSAELSEFHKDWKSLSSSQRAVVQERLEESKKNWLMTVKRV